MWKVRIWVPLPESTFNFSSGVFILFADIVIKFCVNNFLLQMASNSLEHMRNISNYLNKNSGLTEMIGFEAGYSHFFGASLIASPTVKNVANANLGSNWAYLQINIKPEFLFK